MSDEDLRETDERIRRMREAGHVEPTEEEKQRTLDETLTMLEWASPGE